MTLDNLMDKAFDLLMKNLEDRKVATKAEGERLSEIEAEREKTKRMGFSSQERIQHFIDNGLFERQELVNQGMLSKQELVNSGLMDRQVSENKTRLDERKMMTTNDMTLQQEINRGALERSQLATESAENIVGVQAESKSKNNWMNLPEYDEMGTVINERLVNPNTNKRIENSETEKPDNIEGIFKKSSASNKSSPSSLIDRFLSIGRHTTKQPEIPPRSVLPAKSNSPNMASMAINGRNGSVKSPKIGKSSLNVGSNEFRLNPLLILR